jgi:hypothetical protein
MYKIIDNAISKKDQDFLVNTIINNKYFSWFFRKDVTRENGKQNRHCFTHNFVVNGIKNSEGLDVIQPLFKKYIKNKILNFKSILQLPLNIYTKTYDTPHRDIKTPHNVYLYYVLDSDGETVLFKNKKIFKKIKPVKGRLVIFEGKTLHTAYQPKKNIRCILNINEEKYVV